MSGLHHAYYHYRQSLAGVVAHLYHHRLATALFSTFGVSFGFLYLLQSRRNQAHVRQIKQKADRIEDKPCKYPLGNETSDTCTLPDGRKLGYAEYGTRDGKPIFFLHGSPGSRIEAASLDGPAKDLNVRIISVDRPGIGWSSPHPGRTLEDFAKDIETLAASLGLEKFVLVGVSGGGPYSLACARFISQDKLKAAACVVGMGAPDMSKKGMRWFNWLGFQLGYPYLPAKMFFWAVTQTYEGRLDLTENERYALIRERIQSEFPSMPIKDRPFWEDEDNIRLFLRSMQEVRTKSSIPDVQMQDFVNGFLTDGRVLSLDWKFKIEDIPQGMPVRIWYGEQDVNCPPGYGRETMRRLGDRKECLLRIEDETHISMWTTSQRDILKDLLRFL